MSYRLDPKVKADWIAALRSGDYKQGRQALKSIYVSHEPFDEPSRIEHCCLGVFCELDPDVKFDGPSAYMDGIRSGALIPSSHPAAALLNTRFLVGTYRLYDSKGEVPFPFFVRLPELNDQGFTFDQIADIIDYAL